jgi:uncharacterized membrane protein YjfL (UPF0719 family)
MAYQTLENITDLGLREVLNFPNLNNPSYYPILLMVFFIVFTSLTFFRELKREGRANLLSSLAVGGYVTTAIASILSLLQLVSTGIVITTLSLSVVFQAIYLFTKSS